MNRHFLQRACRRRGLSLLEMLFVATLLAILAGASFRALSGAEAVRGRSADRLELLAVAQRAADAIRDGSHTVGAVAVPEGITPENIELKIEASPHDTGLLELRIAATRASVEGDNTVVLTVLAREAGS